MQKWFITAILGFSSISAFSHGKIPQTLTKMYCEYIQNTFKTKEECKFSTQKITSEELIPEAAGPIHFPYNRYFVWSDKYKVGFRPINTTTGCSSGCTPVVFHLVVDPKGQSLDILEQPGEKLRKVFHQPFSSQDMDTLKRIVKTLPQGLAYVSHPHDLTNNHLQFPPQTWSTFKQFVVEGGAYTSYAVYSVALNSRQFLQGHQDIQEKNRNEFYSQVRHYRFCSDQTATCLTEIKRFSAPTFKLTEGDRRVVYRYYLRVFSNILFTLSKAPLDKEKRILNLAIDLIDSHSQIFASVFQNEIFSLMQQVLAASPNELFSYLATHFKSYKLLDPHTRDLLDAIKEGGTPLLSFSNEELIRFISVPQLTMKAIKSLYEAGHVKKSKDLCASMMIRRPDFSFQSLSPEFMKDIPSLMELKKEDYLSEVTRNFALSPEALPSVSAYPVQGMTKPVQLPISGKNIYIFFAAWCDHCQALIGKLIRELNDKNFSKIQLVEVFSKGPHLWSMFANKTELHKYPVRANSILSLGADEKKTAPFYEQMSLFAVPKIVITNSKGEILLHNYDLEKLDHFVRDADWLLQDIEKRG